MGLQPKLQRPEWWRTLNAGRELLDPGVFASYKDDLSWKDLSGLKLSKTRYYCSEYAKNDSRIASNNPIGLYNNVPSGFWENWGWRNKKYFPTTARHQSEPLNGIHGVIHENFRRRRTGKGISRMFTQYQTNDTLKRSPKQEEERNGSIYRWDLMDFSFCEPDGVLKPVWQNFNLSNSSLQSADLRYIDLSSATLTGIQSGGVITNSDTKLPRDWIESGGFLLGPTADLRRQDLNSISIHNVDLSRAKLDDIKSQNLVGIANKLPPNWSLHQLGGNNNNGILIGPKANLQDTDLGDLDLSSLSIEDLKYIKSGNTKGNPILPNDWTKRYGMLFGPKANLKGKDLTDKNLRLLNLNQANLEQSILAGVKSGGIIGNPKLPEGYQLGNGYIFGPRVNLSNASLTGLDLNAITEGDINLDQATLSETTNTFNLKTGNIIGNPILPSGWKVVNKHLIAPGVNLDGADFSNADLSGINLYQIDLSQAATLAGITSGNIHIRKSDKNQDVGISQKFSDQDYFLPDHWSLVKGYLIGPKANLSGANLSNADLKHTNLEDADLSNATLDGVTSGEIQGGKPKSLPNGWFTSKGFLIGPGANLDGSRLNRVQFSEKNITGIDLTGSDLYKVRSGDVTIARGAQAQLPEDWHLVGGFLLGPTADLSNKTLTNLVLSKDIDLTKANLYGLQSNKIFGNAILPDGWKLVKQERTNFGFLLGPGADLEDANFFNTNLSDVDLGSLDLSTSNLNGVRSKRTTGSPQLPDGWKLEGGYLLGPTADLSYAYLNNANVQDVDLSLATLSNARGYGLTGEPLALPTGWGIRSGILMGPEANLSGKILKDADLEGIDLRKAKLINLKTVNVTAPKDLQNKDWLPSGWKHYKPTGTLIGEGAYLKNIALSGDLGEFNFKNVKSSGIGIDEEGDYIDFPLIRGKYTYGIFNGHIVGPDTNLTGADLSNVDFALPEDGGWSSIESIGRAQLYGVKSGGIVTEPRDLELPRRWNLVHGYLLGPGRTVDGKFKPGADLTDADFRIENHPLFQDGGVAPDAAVDLSQIDLTGIISKNIKWDENLQLRPGWASFCPDTNSGGSCSTGGYFLGERVALPEGADLNDLDTIDVQTDSSEEDSEFVLNMRGATLEVATFDDARLAETNFKDAALTGADFSKVTEIVDVSFKRADLRNAKLNEGVISDSDFRGADLTGAQIGTINLDDFNQKNTFNASTICPDGTASNGQGCLVNQLI